MNLLSTLALLPLLAVVPQHAPAGAAAAPSESFQASVYNDCVLAHSTDIWTLNLTPGMQHLVTVRGDGDTDLDFFLYDSFGNLVASDTDLTDICFLRVPASWQRQYELRIVNLGSVFNCYTLTLE